jgi:serine/threonine-protein kinase
MGALGVERAAGWDDQATTREAARRAKGQATPFASAIAWLGRLTRSASRAPARRPAEGRDTREHRQPTAEPPITPRAGSGKPTPPPRYTDVGEIGRGGMGSVRRVRDTLLLRDKAMKLVAPDVAPQEPYIERLIEEAQITGQLEHPNIVPVHDLGVDANGIAYFTMKAVQGCTLYRWLHDAGRPPGSQERLGEGLEIFVKVCDAISYAHCRGVIHRDLKSGNVLVGEYGAVYVVDWGLARIIRPGVETSGTRGFEGGSPIGTVAYVSPEAARGDDAQCDERTDVFGLGALLYELVTGSSPYPNSEDAATVELAKQGEYVPIAHALRGVGVSQQLLKIVHKAMARDREDRYPTVADLKRDLQRFLRGGLSLRRRAFAAGSRILSEDQDPEEAYVVVKGQCEIWRTIDGRKQVLHRIGPSGVIGESALRLKELRGVNVDAIDAVTALVVTRADLEQEMGEQTWVWTLLQGTMRRLEELELALGSMQSAAM